MRIFLEVAVDSKNQEALGQEAFGQEAFGQEAGGRRQDTGCRRQGQEAGWTRDLPYVISHFLFVIGGRAARGV